MVVEQDSDADYRTHGGLIIFPNMHERIQIEDVKIFYSFALPPFLSSVVKKVVVLLIIIKIDNNIIK